MALTGIIPILLIASVLSNVPTTVRSRNCESETFAHCIRLPQLNSKLHYTYNATNGSLSIAFISTPSKPGGWISWSINPTSTGMIGAQAFVAYELNNTLRTETLNIASFKNFIPGNLSFPFWNVSAEKRNGTITLYASLAVPGNKTEVNQVWQIGPGTEPDGRIMPHAFASENKQSTGVLSLTGAALTPEAAPVAPAPAGNKTSNGSVLKVNGGFDLGMILGFVVSFVTLCLI